MRDQVWNRSYPATTISDDIVTNHDMKDFLNSRNNRFQVLKDNFEAKLVKEMNIWLAKKKVELNIETADTAVSRAETLVVRRGATKIGHEKKLKAMAKGKQVVVKNEDEEGEEDTFEEENSETDENDED